MTNNKKNKNEKVKVDQYRSDGQKEAIRFGIILLSIIIVVVIIYFIGNKVMSKNVFNFDNVTAGVVSYDVVSVGTMFNRPYGEYYVAIYNAEDEEAIYYSTLINEYINLEDSLKVYFCDLSNKLNEKYIANEGESSNPEAVGIKDLSFGKFTFVKIKDGVIDKYLESVEEMKSELGV